MSRTKKLDKQRRRLREQRHRQRTKSSITQKFITLPSDPKRLIKFILDPKRLTTPRRIDNHVIAFCKKINPYADPIKLTTQPEGWSRQNCCDLNVKRYIREHGGTMVCGYRIWYHQNLYIEGERHAIWASDSGTYRDVSFSLDGEHSIVFIVDVADKQQMLEQNDRKIRQAVDPRVENIVFMLNATERTPFKKMDDETAWNTMRSYDDLNRGTRHPTS